MKAQYTLTVPLMERAGQGDRHLNGICVSGRSRDLLLEIRQLLDVFAPVGDDYRHGLWIEVPRGKPSDWCSFKEAKKWSDEKMYTRADYLKEWKDDCPRKSQWYNLSVSRHKGHTYLHMAENDHWWCLIHDDKDKQAHEEDMTWLMEPLAAFLREKVPQIAADVDAYNRYVEEHLPKRQRTGRIARKDLNRIVLWQRCKPRRLKAVIRMLKDCIANEAVYRSAEPVPLPSSYREPLSHMSIRIYAKYFRVAYMAFKEHSHKLYRRNKRERDAYAEWQDKTLRMTDIEFYRHFQLGRHGEITDETDFDSEEAFKEMAFDHYGELGLSRNDVHATDYYTPGKWLIAFGVSYSAWVDAGCEIALALYEAGAPLLLHDAQKVLDILEARDYVKLTAHTFHDYLNQHEEGSVFSLSYECYLGEAGELTREQYEEIVALAEWTPEEPLALETPVPENDPVYDLIHDRETGARTACEILSVLEKQNGINVGISKYDDRQHIYVYGEGIPPRSCQIEDARFVSVNEAILAALHLYREQRSKKNENY